MGKFEELLESDRAEALNTSGFLIKSMTIDRIEALLYDIREAIETQNRILRDKP